MDKHVYLIRYGERGGAWAHDDRILLQSDTQESTTNLENGLVKRLPRMGFEVSKLDVRGIVCLLNRCGGYSDMCAQVDRIIKEDASKDVRERYAKQEAIRQKVRSISSGTPFKLAKAALMAVEQQLEQLSMHWTRGKVVDLLNDFSQGDVSWSDIVYRLNYIVVAIEDEQRKIRSDHPGISFDGASSC